MVVILQDHRDSNKTKKMGGLKNESCTRTMVLFMELLIYCFGLMIGSKARDLASTKS